jgi:hypothetical protein
MQILIKQLGFFAPSLFGLMPTYANDAMPWIKGSIITNKEDLSGLQVPDFFNSGLLPLVHHIFTEARELLPDDFYVKFTTWLTGPYSLMFHLRGPMILVMDLLGDSPFVHEMMGFAAHCMKTWWFDRARFLKKAVDCETSF